MAMVSNLVDETIDLVISVFVELDFIQYSGIQF